MEQWRDIPNYEGFYQVSDVGLVRSLPRLVTHWRGGKRLSPGKVLQGVLSNVGYLGVSLCKKGKIKNFPIHHLVLLAFVGPKPSERHYGLHKNDKRTNNILNNLYWGTQKNNLAGQKRNGLDRVGSRNGNSKLSDDDVREIRRLHSIGKWKEGSLRKLATKYGVCWLAIYDIVHRRTWKHIP